MNKLLLTEGAEADYAQSLRWYAERSKAAASRFEQEVERAFEAIRANPHDYPLCDDRHRYYLFKRFPFQIIYRTDPSGDAVVLAVAHASRRPGFWSAR